MSAGIDRQHKRDQVSPKGPMRDAELREFVNSQPKLPTHSVDTIASAGNDGDSAELGWVESGLKNIWNGLMVLLSYLPLRRANNTQDTVLESKEDPDLSKQPGSIEGSDNEDLGSAESVDGESRVPVGVIHKVIPGNLAAMLRQNEEGDEEGVHADGPVSQRVSRTASSTEDEEFVDPASPPPSRDTQEPGSLLSSTEPPAADASFDEVL